MLVLRAELAGFCMGVSLALSLLDRACEQNRQLQANDATKQKLVQTLGPIIHNPTVLAYYQDKGVICLDNVEQVQDHSCLVIRAHGIPIATEEKLRAKPIEVIDATCPKVKKAQLAIAKATAKGQSLLLFGESDHPEVQGLISYANADYQVFTDLAELTNLDPKKEYILAAQTTQNSEIFENIKNSLYQKLEKLEVIASICQATDKRQAETLTIAKKVDAMFIIGGKNSGNTRRLFELVAASKIPVWQIENLADLESLDKSQLRQYQSVGLSAGASTPKEIIDQVQTWLLQL